MTCQCFVFLCLRVFLQRFCHICLHMFYLYICTLSAITKIRWSIVFRKVFKRTHILYTKSLFRRANFSVHHCFRWGVNGISTNSRTILKLTLCNIAEKVVTIYSITFILILNFVFHVKMASTKFESKVKQSLLRFGAHYYKMVHMERTKKSWCICFNSTRIVCLYPLNREKIWFESQITMRATSLKTSQNYWPITTLARVDTRGHIHCHLRFDFRLDLGTDRVSHETVTSLDTSLIHKRKLLRFS